MKLSTQFSIGVLLGVSGTTSAFSNGMVPVKQYLAVQSSLPVLSMSAAEETVEETKEQTETSPSMDLLIPVSFEEMVKQTASAMEDAYKQGKTRQIVRILLPRSGTNDQLLQYFEDDAESDLSDVVLAPIDETWQGGIMQLYRSASFACQEVLRYVHQKPTLLYNATTFEVESYLTCISYE